MRNLKNGFSLVEVLVVVIITGILAAVAIPKLFATTAKAKASEITVASATYIKLQSAYASIHQKIGNWSTIGYDMRNSNNFHYDQGDFAVGESTMDVAALDESGKIGWRAVNVVGLGDCAAQSVWSVTIKRYDSSVEYDAGVSSKACLAFVGGQGSITSGEVQSAQSTAAGGNVKTPEEPKTLLTSNQVDVQSTSGKDYSLAKAIESGRNSSNMSGWGDYKSGSTMKSVYDIEGYVLNTNVKDSANYTDLLAGENYSFAKLITEFTDVSGDSKLTAGVHHATQSLYYGGSYKSGSGGGITVANVAATRDVYVTVDKSGKITGYCENADCKDTVSSSEKEWTKNEVSDPFDSVTEEQYNSAFVTSTDRVEKSEAYFDSLFGKQNSREYDYTRFGITNYVANISDANSENMKSMLKENGVTLKSNDQVKTVTEIFSETAKTGTVYAAVTSVFYGNKSDGLTYYDSRKVYGVMQNDRTWYFFSNKECTEYVNFSTTNVVDFWKKKQ